MHADPQADLVNPRPLITGSENQELDPSWDDRPAVAVKVIDRGRAPRRRAKSLGHPLKSDTKNAAVVSPGSSDTAKGTEQLAHQSRVQVTAFEPHRQAPQLWLLPFSRLVPLVLVLLALVLPYLASHENLLPSSIFGAENSRNEPSISTVTQSVYLAATTSDQPSVSIEPTQDPSGNPARLARQQQVSSRPYRYRGFYNPPRQAGQGENSAEVSSESEAEAAARRSSMALADEARRVAAEFDYDKVAVNNGVQEFLKQMAEGMSRDGTSMSQIPTYVTAVPNGTEKGLYMAVDLGGTNFRVCSIQLHGNTTFSLTQSKVAIPRELMVAKTAKELFAFLAKQIELFLKAHHGDHFLSHIQRVQSEGGTVRDEDIFDLGFTFSFPVQQQGINKGTLIRWTKGFDIEDAIGKDVCALLQTEIDALNLPVRVAALVNDTVGTLMARSYTSPGKTGTLLGAIFGTGTNGAYVEKLDRITKLAAAAAEGKVGAYDTTTGEMIVNTEWGSFDNALAVLPNTPYDIALDADSVNPGIQMFEKRVSGMFLGEIVRRALVGMLDKKGAAGQEGAVPLFRDDNSGLNDMHSTTNIAEDSPLFKVWGLDTAFLSLAAGDGSEGLKTTRQALDRELGVSAASREDAEAVRLVCGAVGRRAARLAAVAIAAVVVQSGRLHVSTVPEADSGAAGAGAGAGAADGGDGEDVIDVGVDGSLVEFYPGFEELVREALREVEGVGKAGERRVRIGIAKDGSGVGAALIALVASRQERRMSVAV